MSIKRLGPALACLFVSGVSPAAPLQNYNDPLVEALAIAEGAWADSLLSIDSETVSYDERVFTELSPILDSPEAIKLPEDQILSD